MHMYVSPILLITWFHPPYVSYFFYHSILVQCSFFVVFFLFWIASTIYTYVYQWFGTETCMLAIWPRKKMRDKQTQTLYREWRGWSDWHWWRSTLLPSYLLSPSRCAWFTRSYIITLFDVAYIPIQIITRFSVGEASYHSVEVWGPVFHLMALVVFWIVCDSSSLCPCSHCTLDQHCMQLESDHPRNNHIGTLSCPSQAMYPTEGNPWTAPDIWVLACEGRVDHTNHCSRMGHDHQVETAGCKPEVFEPLENHHEIQVDKMKKTQPVFWSFYSIMGIALQKCLRCCIICWVISILSCLVCNQHTT